MPKMKSHRGAAKRFRVTGSGRIRRRRNRSYHVFAKSRRHKKELGQLVEVSSADAGHVRRQLAH